MSSAAESRKSRLSTSAIISPMVCAGHVYRAAGLAPALDDHAAKEQTFQSFTILRPL